MPDTSSDKLVKKACTAKKGAPKPKYLDPIIALTQSNPAAVPDLCSSLARHLREPNAQIVFKALLVVHNMIRSGGTDNVLSHLAKMDVLRLKSVGQGTFWEGYKHRATLVDYAHYLHARITAYRTLKHDMVRVQAESNRASAYRNQYAGTSDRARKLRSLTVENGLLRETREVQRIIEWLLKCTFYLDDLHDECTVLAFRMCTKDLLVLFQAGNEGIINLLEQYFEMSHTDASEALALYKAFCAQTKKVVEFLRFAKDLNNVIDVPIPNLKHAPVSLVAALKEYLEDPNFEANRQEYKDNKNVADGKAKAAPAKPEAAKAAAAPVASSSSAPAQAPSSSSPSAANGSNTQTVTDFFSSIDEPSAFPAQQQQQATFDPAAAAFFGQQQQQLQLQATGFNPFAQRLQQQMLQQQPMFPQATGVGHMQVQPTGFGQLQPQQTGFGAFGGQQPQQQQQQQQSFLVPQATGYNPFRQSIMPDLTGFPGMPSSPPLQQQAQPTGFQGSFAGLGQQITGFGASAQQQQQQQPLHALPQQQPLQSQPTGHSSTNPFARPQSTAPLVAQPTGSKNPFGPPPKSAPAKPTDAVGKGPSLADLAFNHQQQQAQAIGQQHQPLTATPTGMMSSLASDFAFGRANTTGDVPSPSAGQSSSSSSFLSDNRAALSSSPQPLQPQRTGFAGSSVQPFKPTSSFGSSLLSSLPEVPPPSSAANGAGQSNPFRSSTLPTQFRSSSTGLSPSFTGQGTGSGLTAQPTGLPSQSTGASFGASLFGTSSGVPSPSVGTPTSQFGALAPQPTGMRAPFQPTSSFGQEMQAQKTGAVAGAGTSNPFGQQRLNSQPTGSLF